MLLCRVCTSVINYSVFFTNGFCDSHLELETKSAGFRKENRISLHCEYVSLVPFKIVVLDKTLRDCQVFD